MLACLIYLSENPTTLEILQRLEAIPYDTRLKFSIPAENDGIPPIVIVDIDENSIKQQGRWPWSRKKIARLIDRIYINSPAVIALDIVQSERESNPVNQVKNELENMQKEVPDWLVSLRQQLDADAYFANLIREKEVVLGYPFHKKMVIQSGKLKPTTVISDTEDIQNLTAVHMLGYSANLNEFTNSATGIGFFSIIPDRDGNVRRAPIVAVYNDQVYPSLALEVARLYLFEDTINLHTKDIGRAKTVTSVSLGKTVIPTDAQGQILIPYRGKQKHFDYISANDILKNDKPIPELENAIVLIGTSAVGLADLRPTPVQASFPGVEIQANILYGLLHPETIAYVPDWTAGATIVWLVLLGFLMILLYPLLQPVSLVITGTGLLFITFGLNYWLWAEHKINLPIILAVLLIMAVSSIFVVYGLLRENKDKRLIHEKFGQYVPIDHINKLVQNPKEITTDGERREMTVMFSDLRDFTSLSEPLTTRELKRFLNHYLTPITKIIFDNQGTIDKYVGDMVMAFWGAPLHNPQHASLAVKAALDIQEKIRQMRPEFKKLGINQVAAGIGIHTGAMNVGDMGSDYRRAYTVLGDAVNLGSRLEALTKFYDVKILVSEASKDQCPEIEFRCIDFVRVKGKQEPIRIYEPVGFKSQLSDQQLNQLEQHEKAFASYDAGEWQQAYSEFTEINQQYPEHIYQIYLQRISSASHKPAEDWDGIHNHETK